MVRARRNPLLLAAREVDASLADLGEISRREQRDVRVQCARLEHGVVPG